MRFALDSLNQISKINGIGSRKLIQDQLIQNDCEELRYLLKVALDPFLTTRIAKLEASPQSFKFAGAYIKQDFGSFQEFVQKMNDKKGITDEERQEYFQIVNSFPELWERELMVKIVTKSLNIGIGAKEINKAFGENLIPDAVIMKAESDPSLIEKFY